MGQRPWLESARAGRLADLSVAQAALRAAVEKRPGERIFLRERARVIKRYDEID